MKNNLYKAALAAAIGLAISPAAKAVNNGDLFLGFNDAAGSSSAQNDYVIDLGSYSNFIGGGAQQFSINPATFTAAYSADGNALNDVAVGAVAGGQTSSGKYLFATGSFTGNPTASNFNNAEVAAATVFSNGSFYASAGSTTDPTWSYEVAVSPTQNDENGTGVASAIGNPTSYLVNGDATLSLYESTFTGTRGQVPTAWTLLGTLTVDANSTGLGADTINFTPVPEPGTCGLYGLGGLLMVVLRSRFFRKNA
jgi:hypothetical protein